MTTVSSVQGLKKIGKELEEKARAAEEERKRAQALKEKQAHDAGLSPKEYFSMKDSADADGNGRVSKAEASAALAGQEHRADLWDIICTTNAKNPYK